MQKIVPSLWFNYNAEEAVNFYVSVFKDSEVLDVSRYGDAGPGPKGTVMAMTFKLQGQEFFAINGGPQFPFTPAISLLIHCESQEEVDNYWEKLSEGGTIEQCGWLRDKYGLSWQVVPVALDKMMSDKDPQKVNKVTNAMLQMKKLDIAKLEEAFNS